MVMMVVMMNCFRRMVDRRKAFSLISSQDHCQRFSSSQISDTPRAVCKSAQDLSSGLVIPLHHGATNKAKTDSFLFNAHF